MFTMEQVEALSKELKKKKRTNTFKHKLGDVEYTFKLNLNAFIPMEEETSVGALYMAFAFRNNAFKASWIPTIIKYGLISGGIESEEAEFLTKQYVEKQPLLKSISLAKKIIYAGMFGLEVEETEQQEKKNNDTSTTN